MIMESQKMPFSHDRCNSKNYKAKSSPDTPRHQPVGFCLTLCDDLPYWGSNNSNTKHVGFETTTTPWPIGRPSCWVISVDVPALTKQHSVGSLVELLPSLARLPRATDFQHASITGCSSTAYRADYCPLPLIIQ